MTGDLSPTKNQVNPQPHPADCPVQGKAVDGQEPGEWALLDIKPKKTLVCLEMGILLGKRGGLAIFWSPLWGSQATDHRKNCQAVPFLPLPYTQP